MCGIFGYIGKEPIDLKASINPIHHRGPDSDGFWTHLIDADTIGPAHEMAASNENKVAFAFKRLAIIDLRPESNQPFSHENGRYHIIFNGEIYNYLELKEDLKEAGIRFLTNSDTEILLKAYVHWGSDCFQKLNGMWACCIYDKEEGKLVVCRDRFGIKPLYYLKTSQGVSFFSEIKQIFNHPEFKKEANELVIRDFLESAILDASNETFFKGVKAFPQSHFAEIDINNPQEIKEFRYFDLKESSEKPKSYKESVQEFKALFESSVNLRFRSDMPVGACLSGGLDSSSIVSLAGHFGKKINAFSIDNKDPELSEISYVKDVVDKYNTLNSVVAFNELDDLKLLDEMFKIQDEPISGLGVIAQWRVMKLASENKVTVLLDGQGGDEIFGGYRKFVFFYLKELLKKKKFARAVREMVSFFSSGEFNLLDKEGVRRYLNRTHVSEYLTEEALKIEKSHNISISGASDFSQKSYEDIYFYSYPQLLRYEDRNSMAFSLESRVPFLDYRLVEFVYNLPASYKIRKGFTKAILRDSMKGILPDSVRLRKSKLGFATPEKRWMQKTHREYFLAYFKKMINPYINEKKLFQDFAQGSSNLDYKSTLRIYLFDRWYQHHFNANKSS